MQLDLERSCKECADYTRQVVYRLHHIPMRCFLDAIEGNTEQFEILAKELDTHGYIDLDLNGNPCCLTGKPPVLESGTTIQQKEKR